MVILFFMSKVLVVCHNIDVFFDKIIKKIVFIDFIKVNCEWKVQLLK